MHVAGGNDRGGTVIERAASAAVAVDIDEARCEDCAGAGQLLRVHGPFVSDEEVEAATRAMMARIEELEAALAQRGG